MPNWCYNNISITGSPKKIGRINAVIDILKNSTDENKKNNLFKELIGLPPNTDMEEYNNQGWYGTNVEWFGTKWDVDVDFVAHQDTDHIELAGETAWSPPINFCIELARTYGVQVEMYYEEPGSDFCGKTFIDEEGGASEEDYEYQEGVYRFEGFNEWYNREFDSNMDFLIDCLNDDDTTPLELITDHYGFLTEDEIKECAKDLEEYVKKHTKESEQQV